MSARSTHVSLSHTRQLGDLLQFNFIAFSFVSRFQVCVCARAVSVCQSVNCIEILKKGKEQKCSFHRLFGYSFKINRGSQHTCTHTRHSLYAIHTICGIVERAHRNKRCLQMKYENYANFSVEC